MTRTKILVGGFLPTTTIDYPNHLSAVVFCKGCGWQCRYCHNPDLMSFETTFDTLDWDNILRILDKRKHLLEAVVFSGGEPTLQKNLLSAINDVKALGYKVGLHTNGANPNTLKEILPQIHWVGLDIKALQEDYSDITGVFDSGEKAYESLDIIMNSGIDYEVRTTYHKDLISQEKLQRLATILSEKGVKKYVIQQCNTGYCYDDSLGANDNAIIPDMGALFETFQIRSE